MSLNQGLQKYRDLNRKYDEEPKRASRTDVPMRRGTAKSPGVRPTDSVRDLVEGSIAATLRTPHPQMESVVSPNPSQVAPSEDSPAAAPDENLALPEELEAELAVTEGQSLKLVKEDFSPQNCSRERLVKEYAPLIKYIAQKIASRLPANIELDDLMSSGVIGLIDAMEKYDSSRDNKFKTYAEFRVRGAILDELRAQDWVPRSVREKAKMLERCYTKIEHREGRQATDDEVCRELSMTQNEYYDLLAQVKSVSLLSYDDLSHFSRADKRALHGVGDQVAWAPTPYNEVSTAALKRLISNAIGDLPEKQRLVLSLYYYEDLNLKEIGRVLEVTESRVSQLHTQAVIKLKSKLRHHWDDFISLLT